MFNPFGMGKDLKGMEKMVKPALEKFMKESGFIKKDELDRALERIDSLERRVKELEEKLINEGYQDDDVSVLKRAIRRKDMKN